MAARWISLHAIAEAVASAAEVGLRSSWIGRALTVLAALTIPVLARADDPVTFECDLVLDTRGTEAEFGRICSVTVDPGGEPIRTLARGDGSQDMRDLAIAADGRIVMSYARMNGESEPFQPQLVHVLGADGTHERSFAETTFWTDALLPHWAQALARGRITLTPGHDPHPRKPSASRGRRPRRSRGTGAVAAQDLRVRPRSRPSRRGRRAGLSLRDRSRGTVVVCRARHRGAGTGAVSGGGEVARWRLPVRK